MAGVKVLSKLRRCKTFSKKKRTPSGKDQFDVSALSTETLCLPEIFRSVRLPPGEKVVEWLAVHTVGFYQEVDLLYGSITEFCTPVSCSTMSAGCRYQYYRPDFLRNRKVKSISAPEYVECVLSWVQDLFDDPTIFPQESEPQFQPNFLEIVKKIFKYLHRIYVHIYYSHLADIELLGEISHLNTSFIYFLLFAMQFSLLPDRENDPLREVGEAILHDLGLPGFSKVVELSLKERGEEGSPRQQNQVDTFVDKH